MQDLLSPPSSRLGLVHVRVSKLLEFLLNENNKKKSTHSNSLICKTNRIAAIGQSSVELHHSSADPKNNCLVAVVLRVYARLCLIEIA